MVSGRQARLGAGRSLFRRLTIRQRQEEDRVLPEEAAVLAEDAVLPGDAVSVEAAVVLPEDLVVEDTIW